MKGTIVKCLEAVVRAHGADQWKATTCLLGLIKAAGQVVGIGDAEGDGRVR